MKPIVIIPARMASTRLPDKPLADICGEPMIVHVWRRAVEASVGPVIVAAAEREIVEAIAKAGGRAVLTNPDHPSGSDRIFEALEATDPEGLYDVIVNVQGDLPTIGPEIVRAVLQPMSDPDVDISTLAVEISDPEERVNSNVVKAAVVFAENEKPARALYFSRAPVPWPGSADDAPLYHHIGLYAYRRAALERFVSNPTDPLEQREKLEQLRALALGMRIDVVRVDTVPLGVDTPAELARARKILSSKS